MSDPLAALWEEWASEREDATKSPEAFRRYALAARDNVAALVRPYEYPSHYNQVVDDLWSVGRKLGGADHHHQCGR
jgi:hypothetical protein